MDIDTPANDDVSCEEKMDKYCYRNFCVRRTLAEMLHDRGYVVNQEDLDITADTFIERFTMNPDRSRLEIFAQHSTNSEMNLKCYFPQAELEKKIGVDPVRRMFSDMEAEGIKKAIAIVEVGCTYGARAAIEKGKEADRIIEYFLESELISNVTKHQRCFKHVILTPAEKKSLLQKHKIRETQLPRILTSDPVSRYLGLLRGQVVKIYRKSDTAGSYITYRLAVNVP